MKVFSRLVMAVAWMCGAVFGGLREDAVELLGEVDAVTADALILAADDENRWQMRFTGGRRPGVQISDLPKAAQKQVMAMVSGLLSDYGMKKAVEVAAQDNETVDRLYVAFFGDPRKTDDFVWRVGEHHFTLVNAVVKGGALREFGPILLGGDPYGPWDDEEANFLKVWRAGEGAIPLVKGKGLSTHAMKKSEGIALSQLKPAVRELIDKAVKERLSLLSESFREDYLAAQRAAGGGELRIAFYHQEPAAIGKDGGRWDVKIGNDSVLLDLELSRGHNHMSIWVRLPEKK